MAYLDVSEYERWMRSAIRTLESAGRDAERGDYNWACFKAHQAAEKAFKALLWGVGAPRAGHSLIHMLNHIAQELGLKAPEDVREACLVLDKHYVPTRHPNAWAEGIPEDYYFKGEAEDAIAKARRVVEWVEEVWRVIERRALRDRAIEVARELAKCASSKLGEVVAVLHEAMLEATSASGATSTSS